MDMMITVDERVREAMREMPRKTSASRVIRHIFRAVSYKEAEWSKYLKTPECKELRAFLKPYKNRLGVG